MGSLGRSEGREAFRRLIDESVPVEFRARTWQLLEAVVWTGEPILRGLEYHEVRSGPAAPTATDYPSDGFGVWLDTSADEIYVVLKWLGEFYVVGGTGSGSVPGHTHVEADITDLTHTDNTASNVGDGADIFKQKTDLDLEFRGIRSLSSSLITGVNHTTNDVTLQVNTSNIDHGGLSGLEDDDHPQYSLADGTRAYTGDVEIESAADPTLRLAEGGSATYYTDITDVDIDLYIKKVTAAGPAQIYLEPQSGSPGGDNYVSAFRFTDTQLYGGFSYFVIHYGDGTSGIRHFFTGSGIVHLCKNAGNLTVGGSTLGSSIFTVNGGAEITEELSVRDDLLLTLSTTEPADGELENGEMVLWYQAT